MGFIRKSYEAGIQTVFGSFKNLPAETCYACQADEEIILGSPEKIYRSYLYPYIFLDRTNEARVSGVQVFTDLFSRDKQVIYRNSVCYLIPDDDFKDKYDILDSTSAKLK